MPEGISRLFRNVGAVQDADEGGSALGEVDYDYRSIKINRKLRIKEVAANYTVDKEDTGCVLVATAAITITLPTPDATWEGAFVEVVNGADNTLTVATQTTDTLVADGDLAADSVAWSTASHKIGNGGRFFCHGSKWYFQDWTGTTGTTTIAT